MSQTKTLKQQLLDSGFSLDDSKLILGFFETWLEQKRLPAIDLMTTWNMTIDELLGEIKE